MTPDGHTACGENIRRALRRGAESLDHDARRRVGEFVLSRLNANGGFRGRTRESDLYYTVFGLECAVVLGLDMPRKATLQFLEAFEPAKLDFVHLTSLIRCRSMLAGESPAQVWHARLKSLLAAHACAEGGFHAQTGKGAGTLYDSFLGMLACESLGEPMPNPEKLAGRLAEYQSASGGYTSSGGVGACTTPVTAAALALHWELNRPVPPKTIQWLLQRQSARGGFTAATLVPLPDLLSTATALHALRTVGQFADVQVEACSNLVASLWHESGGFFGHFLERTPDCEYTFYALLALGNLVR